MPDYKLSPSELTYLYDGCKHCFVLKVKYGIQQPSIGLPAVFSRIAGLQKEYYSGKRTETFCPALPPGSVEYGEKKFKSQSVSFETTESTCFIQGRFDIVAAFDDGSFGVLDFKTAGPSEEKSELYGRQLHAYALALENPAPGSLLLTPVTRLGLLYFSPDRCELTSDGRQSVEGPMDWVEIPRDATRFHAFLGDVVQVLDGPLPPPDLGNCEWCAYRTNTAGGATSVAVTAPSCPRCNSPMRKRSGSRGEFWGCSRYPECKGTRNV